uniref:ThiF family protein n=1 Tax=Candidatus Kentrum sp. TUN TaxID=2126343 RepID=A0A451AFU2_9GAMM|nr:MAG: ThiF family protein [Candidatus Kentron sp. TUN]VFK59865.1 MAG: ThiF family protein [Candidatus Kentron sp. TUN]VFK64902.1 MAG: ThiF family protein [Candidatus Kentron sp. TUN]
MGIEYIEFGQSLPGLEPKHLETEEARELLEACFSHPDFDVIELRRFESDEEGGVSKNSADIIVVECCDGTVPSRNPVGIKPRERLALVYRPGAHRPYEARALRGDFPVTSHQNHVNKGEPADLCLYFEPWSAVERSWTPQRFLARILWWLRETAQGTLHRADQAVEQLYFDSGIEIVLPPDFSEKIDKLDQLLYLEASSCGIDKSVIPRVVRGFFADAEVARKAQNIPFADPLLVSVDPVIHGMIERHPWTLGELHDQLAGRDSGLLASLNAAIKKTVSSEGIEIPKEKRSTLLILGIPMRREAGGDVERREIRGFEVAIALSKLGEASGVLFKDENKRRAYREVNLFPVNGSIGQTQTETWCDIPILPIKISTSVTRNNVRRASGLSEEHSEFQGVLAGVGALGGHLADIWSREGWGNWCLVDDDILKPHNIVRHVGKDIHVGCSKAVVVSGFINMNFAPDYSKALGIHAKITDTTNKDVQQAISSASLLVDATTTLEAPRDLSILDSTPRAASVFLTPSGASSVLLLEDEKRCMRLLNLEAQYYRALLNNDWGKKHLEGHFGGIQVGGGCRDVSFVLSNELIHLHAATLARQVRILSARPDACIRTWELDDKTGALAAHEVPISEPVSLRIDEWRIIWDENLRKKLYDIRAEKLPNETGGILLGYFDQKLKSIHVVDALPAPLDSDASTSGFTRGISGLNDALGECALRTANIVGYVGEWHSHPKYASSRPSTRDIELLAYLAQEMATDGLPALMAIVGENNICFSFGQARVL